MISSTAAEAPIMWPSIDFDELIGTEWARSPSTLFRIRVSIASFFGVLVPCGARMADRLVWPKRRLVRSFATTFVTPSSNGRA